MMRAPDNAAALAPVITDLRDLRDAMVRDDRVPTAYFMRFGELLEELQDRLQAAGRIA